LPRQTKALKRAGCDVIYSDKASGKSMAGRPQLSRALDDLDTGHEFVIAEWDRATRSMSAVLILRDFMKEAAAWLERRGS
jgi:DNA invertase Pin-like site-specific DNA recombinase